MDEIRRSLEARVDPSESEPLVDFAEIFFSRAREGLIGQRSAQDLASMALGVYRFLQQSRPDRVDVSVVNPDAPRSAPTCVSDRS